VTPARLEISRENGLLGTDGLDGRALVFVLLTSVLRNEKDAQRSLDLAANRLWGVFNPSAINRLGQPAGDLLAPGGAALMNARGFSNPRVIA
jgi:Cu2+-containing amine oxidase